MYAVAGDRTRVTRVTGGNTNHYTTTTLLLRVKKFSPNKCSNTGTLHWSYYLASDTLFKKVK